MSLRFQGFEVATASSGAPRPGRPQRDIPSPTRSFLDVHDARDGTASVCFDACAPTVWTRRPCFLTAKDSLDDKISGLTLGADDYVTKPFQPRRSRGRGCGSSCAAPVAVSRAGAVAAGEVRRHRTRRRHPRGSGRRASWLHSRPPSFTLLRYFMVNAGTVSQQTADSSDHVWNYDFGGEGRSCRVPTFSYLRRKVDTGGDTADSHIAVGVGYVMREPRQ